MTRILTIDGVDYDQAGRKAASLIVDAFCAWDLDDDAWLEFHEHAAGYQPMFVGRKPVEYRIDGVLRFRGATTLVEPSLSREGRTWGYRCVGLKHLVHTLPFTALDGSGRVSYNLPVTDEESIPSRRGLSVGEIVKAVLESNAAALASIGVGWDAATEAQLAAMTLVPPNPCEIAGVNLGEAIGQILRWNSQNVRFVILPSGLIRFVDASGLGLLGTTAEVHALTLGVDPIHPPMLRRDWSGCAPRVVVRGRGDVRPARVSLLGGELVPAWTMDQQNAWKDSDYTHPGDASDVGTVATTTGPTTIEVQSSDAGREWPVNFWNKRDAWIHLKKSTGLGVAYSVSAPVVACDALTAGGTATLTLRIELENSASDAWEEYELIGKTAPLEDDDDDTGLSNVWRLFDVVTPGGFVEDHLATSSEVPFPFYGLNGASSQLVSTPVCNLLYAGGAIPATFKVVPETGQVLFDEPIVRTLSSAEALAAGGSAVTPPDDVLMLLLYSRGALEASHPPDVAGVPQYAGTAHTEAGMTNTLVVDAPQWGYVGNQPRMAEFARMVHETLCDVVCEGVAVYQGVFEAVLDVDDGHALNFAAACGETGDESAALTVRSVVVRFNHQGGGSAATMEMTLSNRVDFRTDPGLYTHSMSQVGGGGFGAGASNGYLSAGAPIYGSGSGWIGRSEYGYSGPMEVDASHVDWDNGRDLRESGARSFKAREASKAEQRQKSRDDQATFTREARRSAKDEQAERERTTSDGPLPFGQAKPDRDSKARAEARARNAAEAEERKRKAAERRRREQGG